MYKISPWCTRISQNLLLFTLHILPSGRKSWDKIIGKPWKGDVDHSRCVGLFMHRFCTKNGLCFFRLALSECSRYTKCTVLWKDQSSFCQLLIWKVDWRANWWRHKWFNDHYSKCRQKSTLAPKGLSHLGENEIDSSIIPKFPRVRCRPAFPQLEKKYVRLVPICREAKWRDWKSKKNVSRQSP